MRQRRERSMREVKPSDIRQVGAEALVAGKERKWGAHGIITGGGPRNVDTIVSVHRGEREPDGVREARWDEQRGRSRFAKWRDAMGGLWVGAKGREGDDLGVCACVRRNADGRARLRGRRRRASDNEMTDKSMAMVSNTGRRDAATPWSVYMCV